MPKKSIQILWLLIFFIPLQLSSAENCISEYENQLLKIINAYRVSQSLPELEFDKRLNTLAMEHSRYMEKKGKLSHKHFKKRFKKSGYDFCVENVGYFSNQTPSNQLNGWKNSQKHNTNLLNSSIRFAGIAKSGDYVCFIGAGV